MPGGRGKDYCFRLIICHGLHRSLGLAMEEISCLAMPFAGCSAPPDVPAALSTSFPRLARRCISSQAKPLSAVMLRTCQGWPCSRALLCLLLLLSLCVPDVRAIDLNIDDERECSVLSLQISA